MGVKKIDFKTLIGECITELNKKLSEAKETTVIGLTIQTKGKSKKIMMYSADTTTGSRTDLFTQEYVVKNSAEFVRTDVDYILYRELFYNAFVFYALSMDGIAKEKEAKKAIDTMIPDVVSESKTPEEAYSPKP